MQYNVLVQIVKHQHMFQVFNSIVDWSMFSDSGNFESNSWWYVHMLQGLQIFHGYVLYGIVFNWINGHRDYVRLR